MRKSRSYRTKVIVGGIDEAGRGCAIGNLVIVGIEAEEDYIAKWAEWGVKDSKSLSPKKREEFYEKLAYPWKGGGATYRIVTVEPQEIDAAVYSRRKNKLAKVKGLNYLEAAKMAEIVDLLPEAKVFYIDSPDRKVERFGGLIHSLSHSRPKIIARNYADRDFTVVGAASIIAKVTRDRLLADLKKRLGIDIGSGYPDDARTIQFLTNLLIEGKPFPSYVRKSWGTIKRLKDEIENTNLDYWAPTQTFK